VDLGAGRYREYSQSRFKRYSFQHIFDIEGQPTRALLYIAVDDYAELFVNGHLVGRYGSITSLPDALAAQSALKEIDITSVLSSGESTINVFAPNGPGDFNGCRNCRYTQSPAGVVAWAASSSMPLLLARAFLRCFVSFR
jgi:hypothetical protein